VDTSQIEAMIAERCNDPHGPAEINDLLAAITERQSKPVLAGDLEIGTHFVLGYIRQVPYMMKVAWTAANNVGLEDEMEQILDTVQSYWLEDNDVIPDDLGVIGLLDDAYCSLISLQVSTIISLRTMCNLRWSL